MRERADLSIWVDAFVDSDSAGPLILRVSRFGHWKWQ